MIYRLYRLEFLNEVHFGKNFLDDAEICFHSDTLFSALCHEAIKYGRLAELYCQTSKRELLLSDAFPYIGKCLYLPKPQIRIVREDDKGNSGEKKLFKKMKFIPASDLTDWMNGTYSADEKSDMKDLGCFNVKTSAAIRGKDEPELYQVGSFTFFDGNGLYFIAGGAEERSFKMLDELMDSLSYSGLGGKRYAGMGRFEYRITDIPADFKDRIERKSERYMLLSGALPDESELLTVLDEASYQLVRRGGFIASDSYSDRQMRKKDLYVFAAGSCFKRTFKGNVYDVSEGGNHPVWRYACGMFMGI